MRRPGHITHIMTVFALAIGIIGIPDTTFAATAKKKTAKAKTSKSIKPKTNISDLLSNAEQAFFDYQFDKAIEFLDEYENASDKSGIQSDTRFEDLKRRAMLGSSMLGRVENIAIIDSLTVDRDDFFTAYNLSDPTGYIAENSSLPGELATDGNPTVFISESGETMIWSQPTGDDNRRLVSSHLLADDSWESPQPLGKALESVSNAAYPFLMADGSTLYFAGQGDESLGGYDIFISRNNGDEFLQPQNIGMPYNSPYDDYLLVIDELTGAGWWATDRNRIDGKVTIYVFVPQELRVNYPADTPDLSERAKITTISGTGDPSVDRARIKNAIAALDNESSLDEREFQFAMPGGKIYSRMSDFSSPEAAEAMKLFLDTQFKLTIEEDSLAEMRSAFASGASNSNEILQAEQRIELLRSELLRLSNEVVKSEIP